MGQGQAAIRERLLQERKPSNGALRSYVSGRKLHEAAEYAKASRLALLNWTKEVYEGQENVDQNTEHVMEVLAMAQRFENLRMQLEAKASVFGV